jgi:hypothetical protein
MTKEIKLSIKKKYLSKLIWFCSIIALIWSIETKNYVWYFLGLIILGSILNWKQIKEQIMTWYNMIYLEWKR